MIRNFISREVVVLRIYKTLIGPLIESCIQAWPPGSRHGNWNLNIEIEGNTNSTLNGSPLEFVYQFQRTRKQFLINLDRHQSD